PLNNLESKSWSVDTPLCTNKHSARVGGSALEPEPKKVTEVAIAICIWRRFPFMMKENLIGKTPSWCNLTAVRAVENEFMAATSSFKQQCPSCEAMVPIRDPKLVGKKIDCPKCKYRFIVENPADFAETIDEEAGAKHAIKAASGGGPATKV